MEITDVLREFKALDRRFATCDVTKEVLFMYEWSIFMEFLASRDSVRLSELMQFKQRNPNFFADIFGTYMISREECLRLEEAKEVSELKKKIADLMNKSVPKDGPRLQYDSDGKFFDTEYQLVEDPALKLVWELFTNSAADDEAKYQFFKAYFYKFIVTSSEHYGRYIMEDNLRAIENMLPQFAQRLKDESKCIIDLCDQIEAARQKYSEEVEKERFLNEKSRTEIWLAPDLTDLTKTYSPDVKRIEVLVD